MRTALPNLDRWLADRAFNSRSPIQTWKECDRPQGRRPVAANPGSGRGEKQPGASYSTDLPRNDFEHIAVIGLILRQFSVA
jgi:hypothetical protein